MTKLADMTKLDCRRIAIAVSDAEMAKDI
jgi:hypothetical protein